MNNNDKLKNDIKMKIAISKFNEEDMAMKKNKKHIAKTMIAACACLILTSGIVFAKDIEKVVKKLFSNTSPAIEEATQNGYVQSVYGDFIYNQGIGIKVDNIVLDELNLNVSFQYENESKNENIKSFRINKFIIRTDTGEKIFDNNQQYVTSLDDVYTAKTMNWFNQPEKVDDYIFKDSILFTMGDRSKEKKELKFEIQSFDVTYLDNTMEEVFGEWNFNVKITEEMRKSQTIKYKILEENEHIESCNATLYPTGLKVEFVLKTSLDPMEYSLNENITGPGFFFIKNSDSTFTFPNDINIVDNVCKHYIMQYDNIGIYSEIPEKIEIYMEPFESSIFLVKE